MDVVTNRLELRAPQIDFCGRAAAYYVQNREFLAQFEPERDADFYTGEAQRMILFQEIMGERERTVCAFYLFLKGRPEEMIGKISLNTIVWGGFCSCFLGYKMDERLINQGYMTEAVEAVVSYAFETLGLHRIEANVMPGNVRSLRVLEKCGFQNEGLAQNYLKINGVWEDHYHMVKRNERMERRDA